MTLTAQQIANALTPVVDTLEIPALGGTVRVRASYGADPHYIRYVYGNTNDPVGIAQSINALRLGDDDKAADRRVELWEGYLSRNPQPSKEELNIRRMVGTLIVSVIDDDGNPIWTWDQADEVRALFESNLNAALFEVVTHAWRLAAPEDLDTAGKASEPTPSS